MSQAGILGNHPQEGGGHHHAPQDHPQVEEVAVEEVAVEAVVEEHSRYLGTHLPNPLKSF